MTNERHPYNSGTRGCPALSHTVLLQRRSSCEFFLMGLLYEDQLTAQIIRKQLRKFLGLTGRRPSSPTAVFSQHLSSSRESGAGAAVGPWDREVGQA